MSLDTARIAGLVGSRLCHDLVSPVGAISNGLELISLSGSPGRDEMALIAQSCASATARLNFFRVAFGAASAEQKIGAAEAAKLLAAYSAGGRLAMHWQADGDTERRDLQLACLAALCCETALPQGGRVLILSEGEGWRITGLGPRVGIEPALWDILRGAALPEDLAPARVQFPLLALLAAERGRRLEISTGEAAVSVQLG